MINAKDFVLKFYRDAEFGCLKYCDNADETYNDTYWEYYNKREVCREMLVVLGYSQDEINDLDTRLAAEYVKNT